MTTDCPNCGDEIPDPLSIIADDGVCPSCGTGRDELFDIALGETPDRTGEETIADNYAMEVDG